MKMTTVRLYYELRKYEIIFTYKILLRSKEHERYY